MKIFLALLIVITFKITCASPNNEISFGASYNTLYMKSTNLATAISYKFSRTSFYLTPCIRFGHSFNLIKVDNAPKLTINTFIGMHIFGGRYTVDTSEYDEKFKFYCIEAGVNPRFLVMRNLTVGIGFKVNFISLIKLKHFGYVSLPDSIPRKWDAVDETNNFNRKSLNGGFTAGYTLNRRFTFTAEAWFGLTDLDKKYTIGAFDRSTFENNYRLMIGYRFGMRSKTRN
jgi:hypothetical protein